MAEWCGFRSSLEEGRLHLLVEDDGVGIPEVKLATLRDEGIGVSNVDERLKVLFGADFRMRIESKPGQGTRIEIEIPELQSKLGAGTLAIERRSRAIPKRWSSTSAPTDATEPWPTEPAASTTGWRSSIRFPLICSTRARTSAPCKPPGCGTACGCWR